MAPSSGVAVGVGVGLAVCGSPKFAGSTAKSKLSGSSWPSEPVLAAAERSASA
jgi:hypothetical protein